MQRIAHINNGYIVNVSIATDDYVLPSDNSEMLESDAIAAGFTWAPRSPDNSFEENLFEVQPENYKLSANRDDEAEFSKLVTLLTLGLQQNRFLPTTPITIWDHVKMPHSITVERFLEIMVDYGLHCYSYRN